MVFAVAALFLQLHATSSVPVTSDSTLGLRASTVYAWGAAATDGTKPKAAKSDVTKPEPAANPASETKVDDTARTHLNLDNISLATETSSAGEEAKGSAMLTPVSLTNLQEQGLLTVRIPDDSIVRPIPVPAVKGYPSKRDWIVLAAFEHGAAGFDAYTTRQAIGRGAVEEDPTMRPFAHSPAIYAAIQVGPLVADLLARKMQRSENPVIRRMWWMPQTLSGAAFLSSGIHNTGVRGRP